MSVEKKSNYLNIDFQTFLNCLKSIESELQIGLFHQQTDYKLIDAIALDLMQLESKIDSLIGWLDAIFIEDKSKYERASLVLNNTINETMEALGYNKNWQPETLDDDEGINENSPTWYIIILKKINKRLNTKRSQLSINECI